MGITMIEVRGQCNGRYTAGDIRRCAQRADLSCAASAREASILIGSALGTRLLAEGHALRRLLAARMVCGLLLLLLLASAERQRRGSRDRLR